MPFTLSK